MGAHHSRRAAGTAGGRGAASAVSGVTRRVTLAGTLRIHYTRKQSSAAPLTVLPCKGIYICAVGSERATASKRTARIIDADRRTAFPTSPQRRFLLIHNMDSSAGPGRSMLQQQTHIPRSQRRSQVHVCR
ncbi:hypothetical protein TraAM80_08541 [Trypanosoma rangeli]|uniref:Uncharacterized protein n=1 Tax=Trypanosoma rangeli TaxID=5698 RepID=A0A422N0B7_TRYRA|nr:uncharacterized protein TraAM80_08541 [Trypanosoma rangeli]RNE98903.1 hypothetical protein TraAM80_08541 [Trypanosoma rangeli]|eukprot:RNE98903.1 hypothetical protein TraAM80_08541 [Trypanosoma rangeli]